MIAASSGVIGLFMRVGLPEIFAPLVGCSGLLGRSQEHGLALALTLDVPQPLPEPHDSYCVVISE